MPVVGGVKTEMWSIVYGAYSFFFYKTILPKARRSFFLLCQVFCVQWEASGLILRIYILLCVIKVSNIFEEGKAEV